jgi:hypothetical protein
MWLKPLPWIGPGLCAEIRLEFRLLGWTVVLALLIGGGILAILWARSWRHSMTDGCAEEPTLEDYRKLLDAGILDPQEYERIRARLEPVAEPPELKHGIQDPQLRTGIRTEPPPSSPTSDPAP